MGAIGRLGLTVAMATLALTAAAQQDPEPRWTDDWNWALMAPLLMVLSVVAFIIVIRVAVRLLSRVGRSQARRTETAAKTSLDTLEEGLARGEIDQREFEERKRALKH